jgi:hypothetical protein
MRLEPAQTVTDWIAGRPAASLYTTTITRSTGATLATRNVADFDHCGINVVNPWD